MISDTPYIKIRPPSHQIRGLDHKSVQKSQSLVEVPKQQESVELTQTPTKPTPPVALKKPSAAIKRVPVQSPPSVVAVLEQDIGQTQKASKPAHAISTPWIPATTAADQTLGHLSGSWAGDAAPLEAPAESKASTARTPGKTPTLEEFDQKLFAVHATRILPKDGTLKAGVGNWHGHAFEPPSFRPTIHFALGEMVQSHGAYDADQPYAVVTPVRSLKPQLANLSPHDTFIVGDLQIPKDATLVVPEGTDTKGFPKDLKVSTYKGGETLRKAVDRVIQDEGGWKIEMERGGVRNGDAAQLDGQDINTPNFFRSLLDSSPGLSFGSHVYSEEGQAHRLGSIEQCVNLTLKGTRSSTNMIAEPGMLKFYNALWDHHENRLETALPAEVRAHPQAGATLQEKRRKLAGWRAISHYNEELMTKHGRKLSLSEEQFEAAGAVKNQPALLESTLRQSDTVKVRDTGPLSVGIAAEAMMAMDPKEFQEFKSANPAVFKGVNLPKLEATYAVKRWNLIGTELAKKEKLDVMLADAVKPQTGFARLKSLLFNQHKSLDFDPAEVLQESLNPRSGQVHTALEILRSPILSSHQKEMGVVFEPGHPTTIDQVLRAHPKTKAAFLPPIPLSDNPKDPAVRMVLALEGYGRKKDSVQSYRDAESRTARRERDWEMGKEFAEDLHRPLSREKPNAYYVDFAKAQRRDFPKMEDMWDKLGLGREFRREFPTGEAMWNSDWSLVQIMEKLELARKP